MGSCKKCNARHNSLLHIDGVKTEHTVNESDQVEREVANSSSLSSGVISSSIDRVLLSTA